MYIVPSRSHVHLKWDLAGFRRNREGESLRKTTRGGTAKKMQGAQTASTTRVVSVAAGVLFESCTCEPYSRLCTHMYIFMHIYIQVVCTSRNVPFDRKVKRER